MIPPRTLHIGGAIWTIEYCDALPDGSDDQGWTDEKTQTIWVKRGHSDAMRDTLLHEMLHAIVWVFGLHAELGENEETVIKTLAPALDGLISWTLKT